METQTAKAKHSSSKVCLNNASHTAHILPNISYVLYPFYSETNAVIQLSATLALRGGKQAVTQNGIVCLPHCFSPPFNITTLEGPRGAQLDFCGLLVLLCNSTPSR